LGPIRPGEPFVSCLAADVVDDVHATQRRACKAKEHRYHYRNNNYRELEVVVFAANTEPEIGALLWSFVHATLFSHGVDSGEHADDADRKQRDDEDKERVVVVDSDAVVDPGTMMIITINAAPAYRAVFAAGRYEYFAVGAKLAGMHFLEEVNEFMFRLKIAGVAQ
jgi:hypothetical protein